MIYWFDFKPEFISKLCKAILVSSTTLNGSSVLEVGEELGVEDSVAGFDIIDSVKGVDGGD